MTEFQAVSSTDLLRATLFNRSRLAENGCWEWIGSKRAGYGLISRGNKTLSAHRVAYEAYNGAIPDKMVVRHQCDNPSCINPDHLLIGTVADNVADREARSRRDVKGEVVGTSKLTAKDVVAIKASSLPLDVLAEQYGVHRSNISLIRAGKGWKHLNAAIGLKGD